MDNKEEIVKKIKKLLNLQNGAEAINSLEEAEVAALKVQELLAKYNLELSDLDLLEDSKFVSEELDATNELSKNKGNWYSFLYLVICKYNFCKVLITNRSKLDGVKILTIVGREHNVEIVKYLGNYLKETFKKACSQELKRQKQIIDHINPNAFKRAFLHGAVEGVGYQLEKARLAELNLNSKLTALVKREDVGLDNEVHRLFPNCKQKKLRSPGNEVGRIKGFNFGSEVPLNKGLEKGKKTGLIK